jgi:hypothetical protein
VSRAGADMKRGKQVRRQAREKVEEMVRTTSFRSSKFRLSDE